MDYEVLDLGLVYYKNVVPDTERLISLIESVNERFISKEHMNDARTIVREWSPWTYGEMVFNHQKFFPESKDISDNDYYAKEMKEIANNLYPYLDKAFEHYSTVIYPFAERNIKSREDSIVLLKYGVGGHLPAHQDQGISSRVLSTVMYLNDNYKGGEIEFRQSGKKIKPEAGSIIFFPSNFLYVHEVYPITEGFRYSMPHWYHNMDTPINSTGRE